MSKPHELDQTLELPSSTPDSLDAGMAAAFAAPRSSLAAAQRPVLLREAPGDSSHIIKPASDALPPREQTGDRYQLQGEIARGGMGAVLRGRDVDLGRDLAVKVLLTKYVRHPEATRRFMEEAQIGGQLQHPGVVPVYDIGHFGEQPFFTMKLVKGQTLSVILEQRTSLEADRPRFLGIALQVAQTLAYAHAKGVIHRDLKPANIMVGAFGEVQVMDWGLAKVLTEGGVADEQRAARKQESSASESVIRTLRSGSGRGSSTVGGTGVSGHETEMGSLLGTPAYMPPEQASGDVNLLDRRCDVFGLGAILCEILTGKPPYLGRSGEEVRRKAANADLADAHARLAACGAETELVELTKQCLSAEPIQRPRDAQAVADRLSGFMNQVQERLQTAQRERAVAVAREAEQRKRRKVQFALAAALVALLLGGGVFTLWQSEQAMAGREREARNAEAVAALLKQAEDSLRAGDAAKARVSLEAASKRSAESATRPHAGQLERREADLVLLQDLDAVDQFSWTWDVVEDQFPDRAVVATRTRKALQRYGADPDTVPMEDAAAWVSGSPVAQRIVAALDLLLDQEKTAGVRALLQRLDADDFRDAVRDAFLAGDLEQVTELAEWREALAQPPWFAVRMGRSQAISVERRRQLLKSAASRRPGDLELLLTLGNTYGKEQQEIAESVRWCQAAVAAAPNNVAARFNLGISLYDQGDVDGAIACFGKAIELDPKFERPHTNLGVVLQEKGDLEGAMACLATAVELAPQDAVAHTNLGIVLEKLGHMDAANTSYRTAIAFDPKLALAHNNLGSVLARQGDAEGAIACFHTAVRLAPQDAGAHANLGLGLASQGDIAGAIACFRTATELAPQNADWQYNLGVSLYDQGDLEGAITCYRSAIALDPQYAQAHANLGNALLDRGDVDGASVCFRTVLELTPQLPAAHYNLGNALREKGDVDGAIASYRTAIELKPEFAKAHTNLGNMLAVQGDVEGAIAYYRAAIEFDPKLAQAHTNLGQTLLDRGDVEGAIASFRTLLELTPKVPGAHNDLGNALAIQGDLGGAIACFRTAIELAPNFPGAHYNLGNALLGQGDLEGAIACYRTTIELAPESAQTHTNLGLALNGQGRMDEAIACYRKAIELDPNLTEAHYNLGNALSDLGDVDEAIVSFRKLIELAPTSADAHYSLGNELREKGNLDGAIACYRTALGLVPEFAQAHTNLGGVLYSQGDLDGAIACWRTASELDPNLAAAHANLGVALRDQGDLEGAIFSFRTASKLAPPLSKELAEPLQRLERQLVLQDRLPAVRQGIYLPADNRERLDLADLCQHRRLHRTAARLFAEAFAEEPELANALEASYRFTGACCSARAAAGQGEEAAEIDQLERTRLRGQALDWLRAELQLLGEHLQSGEDQAAARVQRKLEPWQRGPDLASIRDPQTLAQLPEDERSAFEDLWAEVARLFESAKE
jgi:eukaryotic-like serine/threonine-protein kinase